MPRHLHHRFLPARRHHFDVHLDAPPRHAAANNPAVATLVSVVYVTATPTFTGAIGGYLTLSQPTTPTAPFAFFGYPAPSEITSTSRAAVNPFFYIPATSTAHSTSNTGTLIFGGYAPQSTHTPSSTTPDFVYPGAVLSQSSALGAIASISTAASSLSPSSSQASRVTSAAISASASSSHSTVALIHPTQAATLDNVQHARPLSTAAQVGIAVGAIVGVGLLFLLLYLLYRRRKSRRDARRQSEDEKALNPPPPVYPSHVSVRRTSPEQPPRLSLRPMTQMFPGTQTYNQTNGKTDAAKRNAPGSSAFSAAAPAAEAALLAPQAAVISDRKALPNNSPIVGNPSFAALPAPLATSRPSTAKNVSDEASNQGGDVQVLPIAVARKPLSIRSGRSVEVSDDQDASAAKQTSPVPAPAPPIDPSRAPLPLSGLNVHRAQLDFKPTMDDELELREGQLVRLLHEYDDGWALCTRLDRSKQGVAPRTCLSRLPVKPRPQNGPAYPRHVQQTRQARPNYAPRPGGRFSPPRQGQAQDLRSATYIDYRTGRARAYSNGVAQPDPNGRMMHPGPFNNGQFRGPAQRDRPRANSASQMRSPPKEPSTVLGPSSGNGSFGSASPSAMSGTPKAVPGQAL